MTKAEIPKAKDNELITEYVSSYALLLVKFNLDRGTAKAEKHCKDLEKELLKRGILTEENIRTLNG